MPFVVIIRADDKDHFLMGDNTAHIIGFNTTVQALEYYETTSLHDGLNGPPPGFTKRNGYRLFEPSIVDMPVFKELVQNLLAKKPVPLLISTDSDETHIAITTSRNASAYWEKGRHRALHWLRKGQHSANTKLKGREQEIIELLMQGLKAEQIGKRLGVHGQTVRLCMQMQDLEKRCSEIQKERQVSYGSKVTGSPRKRGS